MKEALYWDILEDGRLGCALCPHRCVIPKGGAGHCGPRRNREGSLFAESYGAVTALALDPIEKKPLRHFLPGRSILSLGSWGCNLACPFCQNHEIAAGYAPGRRMAPEEVAELSRAAARQGSIGVAYTYNEPLVGYEFVLDCARLIREQGQRNVLVTNGFILPRPLEGLLETMDAMNIDLKGFTESYYRHLGGGLETVKETIRLAAARCHVEVTTLILPGGNDSPAEMDALSAWLAGLNRDIPLHLSRFFPRHKMADADPTPPGTIRALIQTARHHLRYVYGGNL